MKTLLFLITTALISSPAFAKNDGGQWIYEEVCSQGWYPSWLRADCDVMTDQYYFDLEAAQHCSDIHSTTSDLEMCWKSIANRTYVGGELALCRQKYRTYSSLWACFNQKPGM